MRGPRFGKLHVACDAFFKGTARSFRCGSFPHVVDTSCAHSLLPAGKARPLCCVSSPRESGRVLSRGPHQRRFRGAPSRALSWGPHQNSFAPGGGGRSAKGMLSNPLSKDETIVLVRSLRYHDAGGKSRAVGGFFSGTFMRKTGKRDTISRERCTPPDGTAGGAKDLHFGR